MQEHRMGISGRIAAYFQSAQITPLLALLLAFWAWRKYRAYQRNKHPVTTV